MIHCLESIDLRTSDQSEREQARHARVVGVRESVGVTVLGPHLRVDHRIERGSESRDAAHAQDARTKARGALIGVAGTPIQVRNHDDAGMRTTAGASMRSTLPIAGFAVIEANGLEEVIALVAKTPCAVAHGVVEVWPLQEMP